MICIFTLLSVGTLAAQVRRLTVREFDGQIEAAFDATEKKMRRISAKVTNSKPGTQPKSSASTYEYIPPDRFRFRSSPSWEREFGEYIEAEKGHYIRGKGGVWEYFAFGCSEIPPYLFWSMPKDGEVTEVKTSELREEKLDGKTARKYSRKSRQIFEQIDGFPPTPPVDSLFDIWVGSDGLVLRGESVHYDGEKGNVIQKWVLLYEYDPKNLKIEAPIE